ncbi:MAG: hypothetical protein AMXMBFR13_34350 [Phycisphaerae bacterium]
MIRQPPHVAIVTVDPVRIGGMQKFSRFLVSSLLQEGWPVTIALSGLDIYQDLAQTGEGRLNVDHVDWIDETFKGDREYRLDRMIERRRWFRRIRADVAVFVQSSNTPFRSAVVGAALARVPVVVTHRTMAWPVDIVPSRRHLFGLVPGIGLHGRRMVARTWLTAALASRIVYNSEAVRQGYESLYHYPRRKGIVIPNAVEMAEQEPASPADSAAPITVGFVGRISREKRLEILLQAFAGLQCERPVRLLICGEGPERPRLESLGAELGLTDAIEWQPPTHDVNAAYRRIDMAVLSSPRESSSNMVLETLAAGKPAVVTSAGGSPELIGSGQCGIIVPPLDVAALRDALRKLILDDQLRRQMGAAGRARAQTLHDPKAIRNAWLRLLVEVAGRQRGERQCSCTAQSGTGIPTPAGLEEAIA